MMMIFFLGVVTALCWVAAAFFYKFWKKTADQLFLVFSFAFVILGLERFLLAVVNPEAEYLPLIYLMRLTAFLLIIYAIAYKNGRRK